MEKNIKLHSSLNEKDKMKIILFTSEFYFKFKQINKIEWIRIVI